MLDINQVHQGDCLELMLQIPDSSIDSIVTDPPYGWSFMGKRWDYDVPSVEVWQEALRCLKPGGYALVACGTRTQHRMAVNLEDAGFEIRDVIAWVYGSGFPKSHDISKAIDKKAGAERKVVGNTGRNPERFIKFKEQDGCTRNPTNETITAPATPEAQQWQGWGTALKPAMELWTLCRKPVSEKTVADNVLKWGTGGINIDGCRVETSSPRPALEHTGRTGKVYGAGIEGSRSIGTTTQGRFPANFIHDGSEEVVRLFPESIARTGAVGLGGNGESVFGTNGLVTANYKDKEKSASRFFYTAKASKAERGEGNNHSTVKPLKLMRYLCRLVTPPKGVVLDPFSGSGSTGVAAQLEGFNFIMIEREAEYCEIARSRLDAEDNLFSEAVI